MVRDAESRRGAVAMESAHVGSSCCDWTMRLLPLWKVGHLKCLYLFLSAVHYSQVFQCKLAFRLPVTSLSGLQVASSPSSHLDGHSSPVSVTLRRMCIRTGLIDVFRPIINSPPMHERRLHKQQLKEPRHGPRGDLSLLPAFMDAEWLKKTRMSSLRLALIDFSKN